MIVKYYVAVGGGGGEMSHYGIGGTVYLLKFLATILLLVCTEICIRYFHKRNLFIDTSIMIEKPQ